jgi:hypothetical protein
MISAVSLRLLYLIFQHLIGLLLLLGRTSSTKDIGLHHAMLLSHVQTQLLLTGLAQLADPDPPAPTALRNSVSRRVGQISQQRVPACDTTPVPSVVT